MKVYNRKTGQMETEEEYGEGMLRFLYTTAPGRVLLKFVAARPYFSRLRALYQKSPASRKDIGPFIEKYHVDMSGYEGKYACFNDFFIRKKVAGAGAASAGKAGEGADGRYVIPAVADSKLTVYRISDDLRINVKHSVYTLEELLMPDAGRGCPGGRPAKRGGKLRHAKAPAEWREKLRLETFRGGCCLVFRLSVSDCHRYHFIDDGSYRMRYRIRGLLHTVRPIAAAYRVYSRNQREVSVLQTEHLGRVIQVEVGALLTGGIRNHDVKTFSRMEEKGYFEFGGSTIIVLLRDNAVIDADILRCGGMQTEVKVEAGERIGEWRAGGA